MLAPEGLCSRFILRALGNHGRLSESAPVDTWVKMGEGAMGGILRWRSYRVQGVESALMVVGAQGAPHPEDYED